VVTGTLIAPIDSAIPPNGVVYTRDAMQSLHAHFAVFIVNSLPISDDPTAHPYDIHAYQAHRS
jgi:hypothetical protein